jgi:uncharacterized protein (TIGR00296 family)
VARLARAAAGSDRRFPPVERSELPALRLEITCLGAPTALPTDPRVLLAGLRPERHGVWLRSAGKTGLLLPQVAKRCGWTAGELLEQVSLKAGLEESAWRGPGAQLAAFTAHSFAVERPSAAVFAPGGEESSDAPGAPR